MIRTVTIFHVVLTTVSLIAGQSSSTPSTKLKIGYVPDADFGCACYLFRSRSDNNNRRYLFVGPADDPAYISLNGKTIRLRQIAGNKTRNERIGDRFWETYSGDGVRVRIDYIVTRVCDPNDENCESHRYKARMAVTHGKRTMLVNAIAVCGC